MRDAIRCKDADRLPDDQLLLISIFGESGFETRDSQKRKSRPGIQTDVTRCELLAVRLNDDEAGCFRRR